ncbi:hypothetical protein [Micromonospora sp. ATA51]|uniref:hypothetical protein n=1 Tax=Micromonospora sp. ATA51 TaxID=2806098 RepID=UPI001A53289B|nr:hypothetical protein [Micromonospora sp. ATA51]MBM0226833.1 hypothetical protein [Micromonospora sp. ATA51]
MADPESVTLPQLRAAFAPLGISLDLDFVRLELADDKLTIHRLVRTPGGLPACRAEGGVQCEATAVQVVDELPAVAEAEAEPAGG